MIREGGTQILRLEAGGAGQSGWSTQEKSKDLGLRLSKAKLGTEKLSSLRGDLIAIAGERRQAECPATRTKEDAFYVGWLGGKKEHNEKVPMPLNATQERGT